jgi:hypothetical protein
MKIGIVQQLFPTRVTRILLVLYLASVAWWVTIFLRGIRYTLENYLIAIPQVILPLVGIIGVVLQMQRLRELPFRQKIACISLSAGLFAWICGIVIFAFYNIFFGIEAPYPSLADIGFFAAPFLWFVGLVYFYHGLNLSSQMKKAVGTFWFFCLPVVVISFLYYFLLIVAGGGFPDLDFIGGKFFLDIGYPLGDVFIMTILGLLLFGVLFKLASKRSVYVIAIFTIGFVVNYFANYSFSYTTNAGTYFVASYVDLLFFSAMFMISLGTNFLIRLELEPLNKVR